MNQITEKCIIVYSKSASVPLPGAWLLWAPSAPGPQVWAIFAAKMGVNVPYFQVGCPWLLEVKPIEHFSL